MDNEKNEIIPLVLIPPNSKYRPEFDALLRAHLSEGYSFGAFAKIAQVNQDTLYKWVKLFPSFREAKEEGTQCGLFFWEGMGIAGAAGKVKNFNVAAWIFNMKNRFGWRDRQEIKNVGPDGEFSEVVTHDKIMAYIEGKKF